MKVSRLIALLGAGALAAGVMAIPTVASAAPGVNICTGTPTAPGTLKSTGGNAIISGVCGVNGGPTSVGGNVIVSAGSTLIAAFGQGNSHLNVGGSVLIGAQAVAVLGCAPADFSCIDDNPNAAPTLSSRTTIGGNLVASSPLGVLLHNDIIRGSVVESGGGGGVTCDTTPGIFGLFGSPAYSNVEDSTINGSVSVTGLRTCWFGAFRNNVGGSFNYSHNTLADPDGSEVGTNVIHGSMICLANTPAVQFGDSFASPNVVHGAALGECGFNVVLPDPAPNGPLTHITIRG